MRFAEFDTRMRSYERAYDLSVIPNTWVVARIDGRSFTHLTKDTLDLEAPYDVRFRDAMITATKRAMDCGIECLYGYTQSDEISVLIHKDSQAFDREVRKWISILASETAVAFSRDIDAHGAFDARLSLLPSDDLVVDYFRWRQADAARNALNSHVYWMHRRNGENPKRAHSLMKSLSKTEKHEALMAGGINFAELPAWQRNGLGVAWQTYEKEGFNPITGETVVAERRALSEDLEIPWGDSYGDYIKETLSQDPS